MFGSNTGVAFLEVLERKLLTLPAGLSKQRAEEFSAYLLANLMKTDQKIAMNILLKEMKSPFANLIESPYYADLEALFYMRILATMSSNSDPEEARIIMKLKAVMEDKVIRGYSKDSVVRMAQEILTSFDIKAFILNIPHDQKVQLSELLDFIAKVSEESGDLEFASSLSIIARSLLMPN